MPVEMIGWIAPRVSSEVMAPRGPPFECRGHSGDSPRAREGRFRPRADRLLLRCAGWLPCRRPCRGHHDAAGLSAGASAGVRFADARRTQARHARPAERRPSRRSHHRRRQRRGPGQGRRLHRPCRSLSPCERVHRAVAAHLDVDGSFRPCRRVLPRRRAPTPISAASRARTFRSTAAADRTMRSGRSRRMSTTTCCGASRCARPRPSWSRSGEAAIAAGNRRRASACRRGRSWPRPMTRPGTGRAPSSTASRRSVGGAAPPKPENLGSQRLLAAAAASEVHDTCLWMKLAEATGARGNSTALVGSARHGREGAPRLLQARRRQPAHPRLRAARGRRAIRRRADPARPQAGGRG